MNNAQLAKLPINQPERYNELPAVEQERLLLWIKNRIRGNEKVMLKYTSYKLKRLYHPYVDNGTFKRAMLAAGYTAVGEKGGTLFGLGINDWFNNKRCSE